MFDTSHLSLLSVAALASVPALFFGSMIGTRGRVGWFAMGGIAVITILMFTELQGSQLIVGCVAGLAGLVAGGTLSDRREAERQKRDYALKIQQRRMK
jgi:hypothetical protein